MIVSEKPWYRFFKKPYEGNDPYFFNKEELSWVNFVEDHFEIIAKEMQRLIAENNSQLKPYRFHESSSGKAEWQTLAFFSWGWNFRKKSKLCPETISLLKKIPGVVSASLSLLEPDSSIPTHRGDTNAIIRSHLGIVVPAPLPDCGFQCGEEQRSWQEGKVLPFCDAQPHSAWNKTSQKRYVLILDVMRPEFQKMQNKVCATIIATHVLLALDQKVRFYDTASEKMLKWMAMPMILCLRFFLRVQ